MLPSSPPIMDELDRNLYTLLSLSELGGCTHLQLLQFVVENQLMTYFDLTLALYELTKAEHVTKEENPIDGIYLITESGQKTLSFFIHRLPHSKIKLIHDTAPFWRRQFDSEKAHPAQISQKENGEYSALLRLFDGKSILMQLELSFPEYQMAKQMTEAWPEHAGEIYRHLIDTLGETKA